MCVCLKFSFSKKCVKWDALIGWSAKSFFWLVELQLWMCFQRRSFTITVNTLEGDVWLFSPLLSFSLSPKNGSTCINTFSQSPLFLLLAVPTSFSHAQFDRWLHSAVEWLHCIGWSQFFDSFRSKTRRVVNCPVDSLLISLCLLRSWSTPRVPTDRRCSTRRWRWASRGARCSETCCSAPISSTSTRWLTDRWVWEIRGSQSVAKLELFFPLFRLSGTKSG